MVGAVRIEITLSSVPKDLRRILWNRKKQLSSAGTLIATLKLPRFSHSAFRS